MTLVNIDLRNQGYETGPDDRVVFYSLLVREGDFGTISTAPVEVRLTDGKATINLAPGPVGVQIIAGQVMDTRVKIGEVPPSGTTTLNAVMMVTPAYTPALQKMMVAAVERAKDLALEQVDREVSVAVSSEVGQAIYSASAAAQTAASEATAAQRSATSADARATVAESKSANAVSRVSALEAMGGLAPGEPVDGQTANLIEQANTLTRAAVGRAVTETAGVISVKSFGAVGDGVTDDTVAVQTALDSLSPGQTLIVPPGQYMITTTLSLSTDGASVSCTGELVAGTVEMTMFSIRADNNRVSLNLDGRDLAAFGVEVADGFGRDFEISHSHVRNIRSDTHKAFGIVTYSPVPGRIVGNTIEDVFALGDDGGPSVAVGLARAIQVAPSATHIGEVVVKGNTCRRIYGEEGDSISVQVDTEPGYPFPRSNTLVEQNQIFNWSRRAIKIQGSGVVVKGNVCVSDDGLEHARRSNVISIITSSDCVVEGNVIRANNLYVPISVSGEEFAPDMPGNIIKGNSIYDPSEVGIRIRYSKNTICEGNHIKGENASGIAAVFSPGTVARNNNIDMENTVADLYLASIAAGSDNSTVEGNTSLSTTGWRFILVGAPGCMVENNHSMGTLFRDVVISGPGTTNASLAHGSVVRGNTAGPGNTMIANLNGGRTYIANNTIRGDGDSSINASAIWTFGSPAINRTGIYHPRGMVAWSGNPAADGVAGWICTESGTPGLWAAFGQILN